MPRVREQEWRDAVRVALAATTATDTDYRERVHGASSRAAAKEEDRDRYLEAYRGWLEPQGTSFMGAALLAGRVEERVRRVERALAGLPHASSEVRLRIAVTSRHSRRTKVVGFPSERAAARFAVACGAAGVAWTPQREDRPRDLTEAQLQRYRAVVENMERPVGAGWARWYAERGVPPAAQAAGLLTARVHLAAWAREMDTRARRATGRRARVLARLEDRLGVRLAPDGRLEAVLGGEGIPAGVVALEALRPLVIGAALEVLARRHHQILDLDPVTRPVDTLSPATLREGARRVVVVASCLEGLHHYYANKGREGAAYVALGRAALVEHGRLTADGRHIESLLLAERWRLWRGGQQPVQVVVALGADAAARERAAEVERVVPSHMRRVMEPPLFGRTWAEDAQRRGRLVGAARGLVRGRGLAP